MDSEDPLREPLGACRESWGSKKSLRTQEPYIMVKGGVVVFCHRKEDEEKAGGAIKELKKEYQIGS
jgi:hypothetical protein